MPSNDTITSLLEHVLTKNNFDFDHKHYLQVGGTAMGTKVAPSFANIFMADFEEQHVYTYPTKPSLWLRYIDDIFLPHPSKLLSPLHQIYIGIIHLPCKLSGHHSSCVPRWISYYRPILQTHRLTQLSHV
jgi:hypothetical protein